jgi:hypothetical protein
MPGGLRSPMELDHVFILCEQGAPEADALIRLGLQEGPPNTHPGQGTACRRFFFANTYLELLWVSDEREAQGETVARTQLWPRWQARRAGGCPFGVVLRPSLDASAGASPPFPTWAYTPAYLPPGMAIDIAAGSRLSEPFVAWLGFQRQPAQLPEPIGHGIAIGHLTKSCLGGPLPGVFSPAIESLVTEQVMELELADRFVLSLTFDRGESGGTADLTPHLPLVLTW